MTADRTAGRRTGSANAFELREPVRLREIVKEVGKKRAR